MNKKNKISAVILAAGLSNRMQTNKTELIFDTKRNFLQKISDEYVDFGCEKIIVVLNQYNYNSLIQKKIKLNKKVLIAVNKYPEKGKFYSLKTGVEYFPEGGFTFIQTIDNPFINKDILNLLRNNSMKADYIIPSYKGKGGHPVLISGKIINEIKRSSENNINIKTFFNRFKKKYIDTEYEKVTVNINTISDYHLYF